MNYKDSEDMKKYQNWGFNVSYVFINQNHKVIWFDGKQNGITMTIEKNISPCKEKSLIQLKIRENKNYLCLYKFKTLAVSVEFPSGLFKINLPCPLLFSLFKRDFLIEVNKYLSSIGENKCSVKNFIFRNNRTNDKILGLDEWNKVIEGENHCRDICRCQIYYGHCTGDQDCNCCVYPEHNIFTSITCEYISDLEIWKGKWATMLNGS